MSRQSTKPVPVLTDNSLHRAFAAKYVVYCLFGLSGVISHIPSLSIIAGEYVAILLAGIVAVTAALAAVAAWNSSKGGPWLKRELYATIVLVVFVAVYDIALIALTILGIGDRLNVAIIAFALLIMPSWRIRYLVKRYKR